MAIVSAGFDMSGNNNDWTLTNINETNSTLTTYDIMSDVPTLTDEDTGNFATLNPLIPVTTTTLNNANLSMVSYNALGSLFGTLGVSSGKWYFEYIAYADAMGGISGTPNGGAFPGAPANAYTWDSNNATKISNSSGASYGSATSNGDIVGVAFDLDAGSITFYKNGVSQGVAYTFTPSGTYFSAHRNGSSTNTSVNFGQRPFAYTPPTGYKKLNTYNLPDSAVKDGSQYMNSETYTGDGTSDFSKSISLGFSPDFAWFKSRNSTENHGLYDTIRGGTKRLISSSSAVESTVNGIQFDSDGVNVYSSNTNLVNYVVWGWRASDSTAVPNSDGSIASTVSANTTSGFSVVTYTGNGTASTIGHGLGVTPKVLIHKNRDVASDWLVRTTAIDGSWDNGYLNLTNAFTNSSATANTTTFSPGTGTIVNNNGSNHIAYCFAEVEGFSKFGSYTGNGSADGPFIYTGFRPAFIIVKDYSAVHNWWTWDSARNTYNAMNEALVPNLSVAEQTPLPVDFTSNGFKFRTSNGEMNQSGNNYIYMAFAENPFKNSLGR